MHSAKDKTLKAHLSAIVKVGEFIITNGLFVKTQDTAAVYGESIRKTIPSA